MEAGEMPQMLYLLHRHEGLSSDTQHSHKKPGKKAYTFNSIAMEADRRIHRTDCPDSLNNL